MSIIALTNDSLAVTPGAGQIEYSGQFYGTDSNASRAQMQRITLGTAQSPTTATAPFTGIPSWVKRITLIFNGISASGTDNVLVQIGTSGGFVTTGYTSICANKSGTTATNTSGYICTVGNTASTNLFGQVMLFNISGNTWVSSGSLADVASTNGNYSGGTSTLSGTLDRVQIALSGANVFDAGSINILYEG